MVITSCLWIILVLTQIGLTLSLNSLSLKSRPPLTSVITPIVDEYFKRDLHFLVVVSMNSTQPELFDAVLSHVHRNNSVPVLALENFTGRSTFNNKTDDDDEYEEEEEETETNSAENDYEDINFSIEEQHDFRTLKRADTSENSVGFIFFVREVSEHCFVYSDFTSSPFWNSRAFIILVITEPVGQEPETIVKMFQGCWDKHSILNLAVVCTKESMPRGTDFPYGTLKDNRHRWEIVNYNPFVSKDNLNVLRNYKTGIRQLPKLFPTKTLDVCGYSINVKEAVIHPLLFPKYDSYGRVYFEGPDGYIINHLLLKMNASFGWLPYRRGNRLVGVVSESSKNIFSTPLPVGLRQSLNRMTYAHEQMCLTVILPKSLPLPKYMSFTLPFSVEMWIAYFICAITLTQVWFFLSRYDGFNENIIQASTIALEMFRLMFSGAIELFPKGFIQRLFIFVCLIYTLIVNSAYQGALTSYLTGQHFYPDINTFKEAIDTEMRMAVILPADDVTSIMKDVDIQDEYFLRLVPRLVYVLNEKEALEVVAVHRNIAKITDRFSGRLNMDKPYFYKDGYPMLHIIDDCYIRFPSCFYTPSANNPFLSRLSVLTMRLSEGGLVEKWRKDFVKISTMTSERAKRGGGPVVINLQHIQAPFVLLFIGLCAGSAAFVFELLPRLHRATWIYLSKVN